VTFVLDASITLTWLLQDGVDADRDQAMACLEMLRQPTACACVPGIWHLEVANVLARTERAGVLDAASRHAFLSLLRGLSIDVDIHTAAAAFGDTLALARDHRLSAYDAAYLELALRRNLPLATRDVALAAAARRSGVKLASLGQAAR
jgi:predicted nucleic acid-binding protein